MVEDRGASMKRNVEPVPVVSVEYLGEVSILNMRGNIAVGDGDVVLRTQVDGLLARGHRRLVVNLTDVTYMDSCGLAELVSCQRRALNRNAEIKLLSPSTRVRRLLAITMLDQVFAVFADRYDALASFPPGRLECRCC